MITVVKNNVSLMLKGFAMGIAEIIPGVSGGTIAFITGIYNELLETIKSVNKDSLGLLLKGKWKELWSAINGTFLLFLISGMILGIAFGIIVITGLLTDFPEPLWAFFFGLIIASCMYIVRFIDDFSMKNVFLLLAGIGLTLLITSLNPMTGSTNLFVVFFAGMIAICALILPGVSGSFMLLLMGMYTIIIPTIKSFATSPNMSEFLLLAVFGLGCLVGLLTFSRVVSWTFKNYKDETFAFLTGVMIGSLNKIWPWRNPISILEKENNSIVDTNIINWISNNPNTEFKIIKESNVLADDYLMADPKIGITIAAFVLGFVLVYFLSKFENKNAES